MVLGEHLRLGLCTLAGLRTIRGKGCRARVDSREGRTSRMCRLALRINDGEVVGLFDYPKYVCELGRKGISDQFGVFRR